MARSEVVPVKIKAGSSSGYGSGTEIGTRNTAKLCITNMLGYAQFIGS